MNMAEDAGNEASRCDGDDLTTQTNRRITLEKDTAALASGTSDREQITPTTPAAAGHSMQLPDTFLT